MNIIQQAKWHQMQKRGMWLHLLENGAIMATVFFLLDALIGSGYTLLIKQGKWVEYLHGVNWFRLLWFGFIVGFSIGLYTWNKHKRAFGQSIHDGQ